MRDKHLMAQSSHEQNSPYESPATTNTTCGIKTEAKTNDSSVCFPAGLLHSAAMKAAVIVAVALLALAQGKVSPVALHPELFKCFN